jgi:hypothetical protein
MLMKWVGVRSKALELLALRESEITNIPQRRKRQRPGNAEPQLGFFTFNRLAACRAKLGLGVPETCILL